MTNLIHLTLSIHDTLDPLFCHGPIFESILNEYLPHLRQFQYTMTHQIVNQIIIKDFIRWPMNVTFYGIENSRWIHIYSLPWPLNKNDKREIPIIRIGLNSSVSSDVKTSKYIKQKIITKDNQFNLLNDVSEIISFILINIKLPFHINKLTFSPETRRYLLSKNDHSRLNYFFL
jgi:hypothetical protein